MNLDKTRDELADKIYERLKSDENVIHPKMWMKQSIEEYNNHLLQSEVEMDTPNEEVYHSMPVEYWQGRHEAFNQSKAQIAAWKQLHNTNEICINNQYKEITELKAKLAEKVVCPACASGLDKNSLMTIAELNEVSLVKDTIIAELEKIVKAQRSRILTLENEASDE